MGQSGEDTSKGRSRVLIAGGGVAALEAALALRDLAEERVSVELLAPEPHFWYRPLAVAEPFGAGRMERLELSHFARDCGADTILGALASVDADRHVARTTAGAAIDYDALLIACGARPVVAVPGALTFRGPADVPALTLLVGELGSSVRRVVFAVPVGPSWAVPLYELALLTASYAAARRLDVELTVVTGEREPLAMFGDHAAGALAALLDERGVALRSGVAPREFRDGALELAGVGSIPADRVVAMPRLEALPIDGVPHDAQGFVPTDSLGRVDGLRDCYAAGDMTTFPVKQGGLAAQQADSAATAIAAAAGADVAPVPFRPVLRGLLLTGGLPRYLHSELDEPGVWWPPSKIVGLRLAPYLASVPGRSVVSTA